jgi:hypothetical protein
MIMDVAILWRIVVEIMLNICKLSYFFVTYRVGLQTDMLNLKTGKNESTTAIIHPEAI